MCTPRYDVTLDRFMRVAHPLPRLRGNVAVDNHTFVNVFMFNGFKTGLAFGF